MPWYQVTRSYDSSCSHAATASRSPKLCEQFGISRKTAYKQLTRNGDRPRGSGFGGCTSRRTDWARMPPLVLRPFFPGAGPAITARLRPPATGAAWRSARASEPASSVPPTRDPLLVPHYCGCTPPCRAKEPIGGWHLRAAGSTVRDRLRRFVLRRPHRRPHHRNAAPVSGTRRQNGHGATAAAAKIAAGNRLPSKSAAAAVGFRIGRKIGIPS